MKDAQKAELIRRAIFGLLAGVLSGFLFVTILGWPVLLVGGISLCIGILIGMV